MSDFMEMFTPTSDPKHLTPAQFIEKEGSVLKTAIAKMPTAVQNFLDVEVSSVGSLASAAATMEGNALSGQIGASAPAIESAFMTLLTKAVGGKTAADIATAANTPAGQAAIQQVTTAAAALVTHLGASASAGVVDLETAILPGIA